MGNETGSAESELCQEQETEAIRLSLANGHNLGLCELSGEKTWLP